MVREGQSAVGAGGRDRLAHDEIKKESERVGKQGCDENP